MKTIELIIQGMTCKHCVMSLMKELGKVAGVSVEHVEIGKARISMDETTVNQTILSKAVEEAGYKLIS
ncbi:MAG: heavy-metal-associated domain-containing protein [Ignavibacteriae bacterium]|nr:heavy-metal-associated domain-containing protein [Ignavibacteriota bacterium]